MNDWNIQSRAHGCQTCEQKFADKQPYFTLLFDEKHELKRLDVCEPCWKTRFAETVTPEINLISRWQGVYEVPPAAPPEAIQKESAETLLRKLIEQNDPSHAAACFILAVMLERKRLLKVKEQIKRDGRRIFIYEHPKSGDLFTIADPDLQLNQLEEVQRDVSNLLEYGLNPPPKEAANVVGIAPEENADPEGSAPESVPSPDESPTSEVPSAEKSVEPAKI
ncbi:MAG: hypothetical protein H0X66_01475 [Verrucomicrobia bacterium]|nr:hypothetical protein [Verrucomicrobiota bacterium]